MPFLPPGPTASSAAESKADGRLWCVAVLLGYVALLFVAGLWFDKSAVLSAAGAPQMGEHFADLSLFAAARQELERGGDPYLKNPDDPWGRPYNYPRLWLAFMRFPRDLVPVAGGVLILTFLVCTLGWLGRISPARGLLAGAVLCSPPLVLAMERGNCDLIIFLIALLSLAALDRDWRTGAWLGVFLAFALKLYPAAGFAVFLREGWRRAWLWLAAGATASGCYMTIQWREIKTVLHHTPADLLMSYGSTHWTKVAEHWAKHATGRHYAFHHLEAHSVLWAALVFAGAVWFGWSKKQAVGSDAPDRHLDAFRLGACLYAVTFVAGSSYVYRLVFLLLCLPWLWRPARMNNVGVRPRRAALALVLGLLWCNSYWWSPLAAGGEFCGWALLGLFGWQLGATTPRPRRTAAA